MREYIKHSQSDSSKRWHKAVLGHVSAILLCFIIAFVFVGFVSPASAAFGLEETGGEAGLYNEKGGNPTLAARAGDLIGAALTFTSVIFFLLMLYGGFMWMTARGNEEKSTKALKTILGAILGLVIVISAYALTQLIFKAVKGELNEPKGAAQGNVDPIAAKKYCIVKKGVLYSCEELAEGKKCADGGSGFSKGICEGDIKGKNLIQ